ncbi:MAG TPA: hypothetical protein DCE02_02080 [Ruminiclostridium sp.]|jgi:hypothetical protein|uniref:Uncharacterized protein n=1 Tax=Acetivibrio saccincola TaxID=1677857 RepID=A0A2K9E892_9FIRM|nr:hypothetical protein [Acetivibrio saccincola]HAA42781.1 hypothetical protein [Ruminiclostridium sp.]AUG58708.1 hypothetical protein HVS_14235 [Acetivibrio saccincola]NLW25979.1 hypothetical protein [Acetivibrio saccincola]PQQ66190.1 hypothetical protein B9R14_05100 [Acetivibrio saccincola]HOA96365.1 hypothetical protein [Acetivibrio saccincola]
MKKFLKRNYAIFVLLILTFIVSLLNSPNSVIDEPAKSLGGYSTLVFILLWVTALFTSMHKSPVMIFSIAFWSIYAITSVLKLSFGRGSTPAILSGLFSFSLRVFYSSLYGITHWLGNINISILILIMSVIFLVLSIVLLRRGRCKLYELL